MIRRLKKSLGIHFSTKALSRNPDICLRQYLRRFRSFGDLAADLLRRRAVTIVQVGANDGSANDPLRPAIRAYPDHVGRALLIEPQTGAFGRLSARYADQPNVVCLNAAVDRQSGTRKVWSIDRDATEAVLGRRLGDGIASFERAHVQRILRQAAGDKDPATWEQLIVSEDVRLVTLAEAAAQAGIGNPDILLVDTEGFDAEIISMALDTGWRPGLLHYEHKHLQPPVRRALAARLRQAGYCLWADHSDVWGEMPGRD